MNAENLLPQVRLLFNITHPDLEDCWKDGFQCAQSAKAIEENYFSENTREHELWSQGWWAGFYDETPQYEIVQRPYVGGPLLSSQLDNIVVTPAANEASDRSVVWSKHIWKIAGAIAATAVVGYQLLELAA